MPRDMGRAFAMLALREKGMHLREVGELYGISRERVRQLLVAIGADPKYLKEQSRKAHLREHTHAKRNRERARRLRQSRRDFRRRLVERVRAAHKLMGRPLTTKEVERATGLALPSIAKRFAGNRRPNYGKVGWGRFCKLVGMPVRPRGEPGHLDFPGQGR